MAKSINLLPIINQLQKFGLPVRFLRYVNEHIPIEQGESDEVTEFFGLKTLKLSSETLTPLAKISPDLPLDEAASIQTLYHEATHAYFELLKETPKVKLITEKGLQYYSGAPLKGGETADDPKRLFHEAAATYVGHRAVTWWSALELVCIYRKMVTGQESKSRSAKNWASDKPLYIINELVVKARKIPVKYNKEMSRRIFGYENEWKGPSLVQTETTKRILDQLREFCNRDILEDKFPDAFTSANKLVSQYKELINLLGPLTAPPRSLRGRGNIPGPQRR